MTAMRLATLAHVVHRIQRVPCVFGNDTDGFLCNSYLFHACAIATMKDCVIKACTYDMGDLRDLGLEVKQTPTALHVSASLPDGTRFLASYQGDQGFYELRNGGVRATLGIGTNTVVVECSYVGYVVKNIVAALHDLHKMVAAVAAADGSSSPRGLWATKRGLWATQRVNFTFVFQQHVVWDTTQTQIQRCLTSAGFDCTHLDTSGHTCTYACNSL